MHRRLALAIALMAALHAGCAGRDAAPPTDAGNAATLHDVAHHDTSQPDVGTRLDARPRRDASSDVPAWTGPARLSETGLYTDIRTRTLAAPVIEFAPRYQLWSDGAEKRRFLWLPAGARIDTSDPDHWRLPVGTRVWKEFRAGGRLLETRLLQKVGAGDGVDAWRMVAYVWADDESDAAAAPDGRDNPRGAAHHVPSQEECVQCHRSVRDVVIGVSALQLAGQPGVGGLAGLAAGGWLSAPLSEEPRVPGQDVVRDALGYLHGNCGHCHNDESYFHDESVLRLRLSVRDRDPLRTPTYRTTIGVPMFHFYEGINIGVVPGEPERSQLWVRMSVRDLWAMPPLCSLRPDPDGIATVRAWITSLR